VRRFPNVNFADQASGRAYARIEAGRLVWVDPDPLAAAASDPNARAGLAAAVPDIFEPAAPHVQRPESLAERLDRERIDTLGRWGPT
jgi:hypothetical protein